MGPSMKVLCGVVYLASTAAPMSMLPPSFKNIMILTTTVMITENMQRTNYPYQDQNGCDRRSKICRSNFLEPSYICMCSIHICMKPLPHKQWVQAMSLLAFRSIIVRYAGYNRWRNGAPSRHIGMALHSILVFAGIF